jgi:hypothetical protein
MSQFQERGIRLIGSYSFVFIHVNSWLKIMRLVPVYCLQFGGKFLVELICFEVGASKSQVGTNSFQVGTRTAQVGTNRLQVGTNRPQVGTKKQLVIHNPNVFNESVQGCRVGMQFFQFLEKNRGNVAA